MDVEDEYIPPLAPPLNFDYTDISRNHNPLIETEPNQSLLRDYQNKNGGNTNSSSKADLTKKPKRRQSERPKLDANR